MPRHAPGHYDTETRTCGPADLTDDMTAPAC